VFLLPEELFLNALRPMAVLEYPDELFNKASNPKAVLVIQFPPPLEAQTELALAKLANVAI
jgi:hypothetical protein